MKRVIALIASITLSVIAIAQELYPSQPQEEKSYGVGEFKEICVSDSFEVTLQEGRCAVKVNADKALIPYILVYVRSGVLNIELDEKSVPSDVKRIYRGKNAPVAIKRAIVTVPDLAGITGKDNAVIGSNGKVFSDSLQLTLTDKATARSLKIEAVSATLSMDKSCQADLVMECENRLDVHQEGRSRLKLQYKGNVLTTRLGGSAEASLSGQADNFSFTTARFSHLESLDLKATRVKAEMNSGSHAIVNAQELLNVKLSGGSTLYYTGIPAIQIDEILRSTFAPYENHDH